MSFSSWNVSSLSSALVDSALCGSQEPASLFSTSASLLKKGEQVRKITMPMASTIHLVLGPVSLPAI